MVQMLAHGVNGECFDYTPPETGGTIAIGGSVGQGGRNQAVDVKTIQQALNDVGPKNSGPAVPLAVDGLIGPKTISAIKTYQQPHIGFADGRVDPAGPTIQSLNKDLGAASSSGGGASVGGIPVPQAGGAKPPIAPPATPVENKAFVEGVGKRLPTAMRWTMAAVRTLDLAADFFDQTRPNKLDPFLGATQAGLVDKYFHVQTIGTNPGRVTYLRNLRTVVHDIQVVISQSRIMSMNGLTGIGVGYFQPDPDDGKPASKAYDAFTFYGGWNAKNKNNTLPRMSKSDNYKGRNLREDTVFFPVSHYGNKTEEYVTTVIVHELAHFVGPDVKSAERIGDHSYRHKPNFFKLTPTVARRTADCYAWFIAEAGLGREPTIFKPQAPS